MKKLAFMFTLAILLVGCKHVEPVTPAPTDTTAVSIDTVLIGDGTDTIRPVKPELEGNR
jgi:PBP1b-binding outer membrane lipoprotein LpoB